MSKANIIPLLTNVTQLDFALLTANSVLDACGRYFYSVLAIQPLPANQRLSLVANVHVHVNDFRVFQGLCFALSPLKNKDQFLTVSWLWTAFLLKTMLGVCRKPMKCAFSRYRKRISEDRTRDLPTELTIKQKTKKLKISKKTTMRLMGWLCRLVGIEDCLSKHG